MSDPPELLDDLRHERRLAAMERERLTSQEVSASRLRRLLAVAGQLAVATSEDEIASAVVDAGVEAIDATLGGFWQLDAEGKNLVLTRERSFLKEHAESFQQLALDANNPVAEAVRGQAPIWLASRDAYAARYATLEAEHRPVDAGPLAFGVAPILVGGAARGALAFVFHDERRLTAEARTYIEVLAAHAGHALERVRLHLQLVDALETRQAMIQASPGAFMLLDADGVVQSWNLAAERMFGWRAEEVLGRFSPTVLAEERGAFLERLASVIAGGATSFESVRRTRDGVDLDVVVHAAPVRRSNGSVFCLSIVFDVSERRRVERGRHLVAATADLLARSLDWERTIPQLAAIPVPEFADWCAAYLLEGDELCCLTRTGVPEGSPLLRLPHRPGKGTVSTAIATGRAQIMRDIDDAGRREVARSAEHLAELREQGMRSYLAVPMRAGSVLGALAFGSRTRNFDAVDVSIADGLAARAADAVENARLYREATRARAEAEAASRAKDEFFAMLGHELRNPLAPIATALDLMAARSPEHAREREVIARQVAHLGRLVDDLLDVSRLTRGRVQMARERIALDEVVPHGVELARPLIEERGHVLNLDVPSGLEIEGDLTRLAQVFSNLLSNAARYTPPGGRIDVRACRDEAEVVVRVSDNGIGIEAEALPKIFEAFVQGRQSLARTEGGLGLGLSIVSGLVTAHGGRVAARSEGLGKGSEFEIRLPALAGASPVTSRTKPASRLGATRHRILVVDDNDDNAELLTALLATFGHETRAAHDGPSALELAARFDPDVALLDLGLPVMDGFELARRLRADPRHQAMRLIAITGYGQARDYELSRSAGFDEHLVKPISLKDLQRVFPT